MKELKKALTFDDILLVPAHSEVLPKQVSLTSKLTNKITLQYPYYFCCDGYSDRGQACNCNCAGGRNGCYP